MPASKLPDEAKKLCVMKKRLHLSKAEFARFVEILEDPIPPTPALMRAIQEYQKAKAAHPNRGL